MGICGSGIYIGNVSHGKYVIKPVGDVFRWKFVGNVYDGTRMENS